MILPLKEEHCKNFHSWCFQLMEDTYTARQVLQDTYTAHITSNVSQIFRKLANVSSIPLCQSNKEKSRDLSSFLRINFYKYQNFEPYLWKKSRIRTWIFPMRCAKITIPKIASTENVISPVLIDSFCL